MSLRHRSSLVALLALAGCAQGVGYAKGVDEEPASHARVTPDLESARELDQSGVRAFKEGLFADAIRFFRAAYRKGGPSAELWNIARCEERLDDGERAAHSIEEYLAQQDLAPAERAEGERELRLLSSRTSMLTVTTVPSGAAVSIDGRAAGASTPLTVDVPPGAHTLAIRHDGYATETRPFEARYGRAVIVSLDLARASK
jgi:hypothetical protein